MCGFSGGVPGAYDTLVRGDLRELAWTMDGEVISIATANVWGSKDTLWPGNARTVYIHDGEHELQRSKDAVTKGSACYQKDC